MPRYCQNCVLPDTRPGVKLDAAGVCHGCRNAARKRDLDWQARAASFRELVEQVRRKGRRYDCVIPVSGGKDSFWQVVTCLEHGLHPLCVTYRVPFRNALGERNLQRLVALGVDHVDFRPNPDVERKFVEKAFRTRGISGLVTHMAVFAVPLQVAVAYDVPLVVYAENSATEYGTDDPSLEGERLTRRWLMRFGVTDGTTAADWVDDDLSARDLAAYAFPDEDLLAERDVRVVFLGHFFPWDPQNSLAVAAAHGFASRPEGPLVGHYDYANLDDDLLGIHQHAKWYKFGITRSWDTLSMEIRAGRTSRDAAIARLREIGAETPHQAIATFCDWLGIGEADYYAALERFRNPQIWRRRGGRWVIDDFLVPDFAWPADRA